MALRKAARAGPPREGPWTPGKETPNPGLPLALGVLFYCGLGGAGAVLPLLLGRWRRVEALLRGKHPLLLQAGAGLVLGLLLVWLSRVLVAKVKAMKELERVLASLVGPMGPFSILVLALVSGPAEEWFFRGALLDLLGPLWSTLAFAFCHTGPGKKFRAWTLMAGVVGGLFAWMVLQGWGLLSVALAHSTLNFLNLRRLAGSARKGASPGARAQEEQVFPGEGGGME